MTSMKALFLAPSTAVAAILIAVGGAIPAHADDDDWMTPNDRVFYQALRNAGLTGFFESDTAALAHGHTVCNYLDRGDSSANQLDWLENGSPMLSPHVAAFVLDDAISTLCPWDAGH